MGIIIITTFFEDVTHMHRLVHHCKPSQSLVTTQLLLFQKKCTLSNIDFIFIHKFLVKLSIGSETAYLKINIYDMEFFFISTTLELKTFLSFSDFKIWFENKYLIGADDYV